MPIPPAPSAPSRLADRTVDYLLCTWIVLYVMLAGLLAWVNSFGHFFDEIEHFSFVRSLWQAPTLFPDYGHYRILGPDRVTWSDVPNYISHPPLYYLLVGPFTDLFPTDPRPIRLFDLALALSGLLFAFAAGLRHIRGPAERLVFGILIFGLPVANGVAALVNNDDLMAAEFGLLLFLLLRDRTSNPLIALTLAALGWTKFTGFIAAAIFVVLLRAFPLLRGSERFGRKELWLIAGLALGLVPALANVLAYGHPVWAPQHFPFWFEYVRPEMQATATPLQFAAWFFDTVGLRFGFHGYVVDFTFALVLFAVLMLVGAARRGDRPTATDDLVRAGTITVAVFALLHVTYAWKSMHTTGSMVEAQSRYYMAVWPLVAISVTHGIRNLGRLAVVARIAVLAILIFASGPGVPLMIPFEHDEWEEKVDPFVLPSATIPAPFPPVLRATNRPTP